MESIPFSAAIASALELPADSTHEQIVARINTLVEAPRIFPSPTAAEWLASALLIALNDVRRVNRLEAEAWSPARGNGIAIFPATSAVGERIVLQDLGDEDGSDLGDEITKCTSLRAAIDELDVR